MVINPETRGSDGRDMARPIVPGLRLEEEDDVLDGFWVDVPGLGCIPLHHPKRRRPVHRDGVRHFESCGMGVRRRTDRSIGLNSTRLIPYLWTEDARRCTIETLKTG